MKTIRFSTAPFLTLAALTLAGCASDPNRPGITNHSQPGPAVGRGLGSAVGAVGGNVAGGVVGFGEGVVAAGSKPFDNSRRLIRTWRTEVTADGRTIQVPVDIEVDKYGRPLHPVAPAPATVAVPVVSTNAAPQAAK
jgi:hypothetical protein